MQRLNYVAENIYTAISKVLIWCGRQFREDGNFTRKWSVYSNHRLENETNMPPCDADHNLKMFWRFYFTFCQICNSTKPIKLQVRLQSSGNHKYEAEPVHRFQITHHSEGRGGQGTGGKGEEARMRIRRRGKRRMRRRRRRLRRRKILRAILSSFWIQRSVSRLLFETRENFAAGLRHPNG